MSRYVNIPPLPFFSKIWFSPRKKPQVQEAPTLSFHKRDSLPTSSHRLVTTSLRISVSFLSSYLFLMFQDGEYLLFLGQFMASLELILILIENKKLIEPLMLKPGNNPVSLVPWSLQIITHRYKKCTKVFFFFSCSPPVADGLLSRSGDQGLDKHEDNRPHVNIEHADRPPKTKTPRFVFIWSFVWIFFWFSSTVTSILVNSKPVLFAPVLFGLFGGILGSQVSI